jgi:multidrug resistance protein, MATE family
VTAPRAAAPAFTRRCLDEWRALAMLAGPIVASQVGFVLMGFLDAVMAGQAGAEELAVVGLGMGIWIPVGLTLMGAVQALSPLVAHDFGAGDHAAVVRDTQQAVWLAGMLGLLPVALLPGAPWLLAAFDVAPALAHKTELFLQGVALGMPGMLMFRALGFYSSSINRTAPLFWVTLAGLASNALFNWLLIYGHFGLPALGGAGCGWSSGIGMWVMCLAMMAYTARSRHYAQVLLYRRWPRPQPAVLRKLLALGLPIAGAYFAEVSAFAGISLLIGSLGAVPIAAHQVALNFAALIFMLPLGVSIAMTVRIGQFLGAGDARAARFTAWAGMAFALAFAALMMPTVVWLRDAIVATYTADAAVRALAATLLLFCAAWQLFDATQVCAIGALRGYKVTLLPMWLMVAAFWLVAIPIGWWLSHGGGAALGVAARGVVGYWVGLVVGLAVVAASLTALLHALSRLRVREAGAAAMDAIRS